MCADSKQQVRLKRSVVAFMCAEMFFHWFWRPKITLWFSHHINLSSVTSQNQALCKSSYPLCSKVRGKPLLALKLWRILKPQRIYMWSSIVGMWIHYEWTVWGRRKTWAYFGQVTETGVNNENRKKLRKLTGLENQMKSPKLHCVFKFVRVIFLLSLESNKNVFLSSNFSEGFVDFWNPNSETH